jgi:uncharacterized membrane protein (DUF4010 family)
MQILPLVHWPYLTALSRLMLALGVGTFVGLEREQRGHPVGLRTFGLAAVLGCMGGLEGPPYDLASLALVTLLVVFLNIQSLQARDSRGRELTTSAAMMITGFSGMLCGQGHNLTPVAIAVVTAALLAWKGTLRGFTAGLSEAELRSAILLAMLTFVVFPALPQGGFGPRQCLVPREAWATVILIAGIGFVNYILLKLYGNRGIIIAGFLGGIVNSTVTVNELASRVREGGDSLALSAHRGIVVATVAMLARNAFLLAVLAPGALRFGWLPCAVMAIALMAVAATAGKSEADTPTEETLKLTSPFSLQSTLKFGAVFLVLQLAGVAAQQALGSLGVYGTAFLGGLISSASAVGAVGGLATQGEVSLSVAGHSVVLASMASILVNLPLLRRSGHPGFTGRLVIGMLVVCLLGLVASLW